MTVGGPRDIGRRKVPLAREAMHFADDAFRGHRALTRIKRQRSVDDLLEAAIDNEPASLWVYRGNPRASAFYVHHDFIPDGDERTDSVGILEIRMVRR